MKQRNVTMAWLMTCSKEVWRRYGDNLWLGKWRRLLGQPVAVEYEEGFMNDLWLGSMEAWWLTCG